MAAKVPDHVTEPVVEGSSSRRILTFNPTNLDNADTVDASKYLSAVDGAWFQADAQFATPLGLARSGAGNTTLTVGTGTDNQTGQVFIVGTP